MSTAATRRRGAAALVAALLIAWLALALLTTDGRAGAQVLCPDEDQVLVPCPSTTDPDDTTTTLDDTSTTEDTTDDTTQDTAPEPDDDDEVVTAPSFSVTTVNDLLVPGDGTEGAESTTTTAPELASGSDGISDDTLILLMVAGLGTLAAVVGVLTWRYWGATRPRVAGAGRR